MCGIADQHKINMATMLKEKQIEDEEVTEAAKCLAEMNGVPRQEIEHIERMKKYCNVAQEYTAKTAANINEREEMVGIIERLAEQERKYNMHANNQFAPLIEDEEVDHGGCPAKTNVCATNWHVTIRNKNNAQQNRNNIMARGTRMNIDDDRCVRTTQSTVTVRRSNCSHIMPSKRSMMAREAAWNVIRGRNWVQQTIADRDKRWCPTNIEKKLSPTDIVGQSNQRSLESCWTV